MADIAWVEAQSADAMQRGFFEQESRAGDTVEADAEVRCALDVADAETCVDEHEARIALDEETVAAEPRFFEPTAVARDPTTPARTHAAAVEVMDFQMVCSPRANGRSSALRVAARAVWKAWAPRVRANGVTRGRPFTVSVTVERRVGFMSRTLDSK